MAQAGSIVISHVTSLPATWTALILLLIVHLATNYRAVRAVQMTSLNRQRANIVFSTIFSSDPELELDIQQFTPGEKKDKKSEKEEEKGKRTSTSRSTTEPPYKVLRPDEVARLERIFERDGVLRWICPPGMGTPKPSFSWWWWLSAPQRIGSCRIGGSFNELLSLLKDDSSPSSSSSSKSIDANANANANANSSTLLLRQLNEIFASESYLLFFFSSPSRTMTPQAVITLKHTCTPLLQLKAWAHALLVAKVLFSSSSSSSTNGAGTDQHQHHQQHTLLTIITQTLSFLNDNGRFQRYAADITAAGWDLDTAALETRSGRRIHIQEG
jgi:hypothetical protein